MNILPNNKLFLLNQFEILKNNIIVQGYIQNYIKGIVWTNYLLNPSSIILVVADFCFLIGILDKKDKKNILTILTDNCRGKLIVCENPIWSQFLKDNFKNQYIICKRYILKREPHVFNKEKLESFVTTIQLSYDILRINKELYYKSLEQQWTADFCCNFISLENYLKYGVGYVILQDNKIISGASSYSYCEGYIDITIETLPEYRRKGLALACASKLILECLEKNIYPQWEAANLNSLALAEKLGYNFKEEYLAYII